MKIDLKKLSQATTESIPFMDTVDLSEEEIHGKKPFRSLAHYEGEVSNQLGVKRMKGTVKALYSTQCSRCLQPLNILLTAEVDTILSDDPSAEEEDDLYVLTGDSVDPAEIFVPALLLEVDMTYLCKADCKGLCPECGHDLNIGDCGCSRHMPDPRFAALRALLDKTTGSPEEVK